MRVIISPGSTTGVTCVEKKATRSERRSVTASTLYLRGLKVGNERLQRGGLVTAPPPLGASCVARRLLPRVESSRNAGLAFGGGHGHGP